MITDKELEEAFESLKDHEMIVLIDEYHSLLKQNGFNLYKDESYEEYVKRIREYWNNKLFNKIMIKIFPNWIYKFKQPFHSDYETSKFFNNLLYSPGFEVHKGGLFGNINGMSRHSREYEIYWYKNEINKLKKKGK